jgi:SSS family solute:Na+ symporter
MAWIDWLIVLGLNGSIIAYGFYLARGSQSSVDWFLGGRSLPWWIVGISMYATAIDASDLVADSGGTYTLGLTYFVTNWVGAVVGWVLAAFFLFLPMYRAGMYTNAEYLESRFGVSSRVLCALVQVQYRTLVLAIIGVSLFWTLRVVCEWEFLASMLTVVAVGIFAAIYTAFGGLRSVVVTDALQFIVMSAAAMIVWTIVFQQAGGWNGIEKQLAANDPALPQLLHVNHDNLAREDITSLDESERARKLLLGGNLKRRGSLVELQRTTPSWLVIIGFIVIGMAYPIVNHTQSNRMLAARSEWDMKMAAAVAGICMIVMSFFNLSMGVMGRAVMPDQSLLPFGNQDNIYPYLVSQIDILGLKGIVVAGIFAASFSTFDSIGSSLSGLLTRDVYARLLVRDGDDRHYVRVGQWLTPLVIGISFIYMPLLLKGGMLLVFLDLTSTFVIPLLTLFLMGALTRVHPRSGTVGLLVGASYGVLRLLAPLIAQKWGILILPPIMINTFGAYLFSMVITASTMVLFSLLAGWQPAGQQAAWSEQQTSPWLRNSQLAIQQLKPATAGHWQPAWLPGLLGWAVILLGCYLSFVVFW